MWWIWIIIHVNLVLGIITFCGIIGLYTWRNKMKEFSYKFWILIWLMCMGIGVYMFCKAISTFYTGFCIGIKEIK
jgi:hypothetical protein